MVETHPSAILSKPPPFIRTCPECGVGEGLLHAEGCPRRDNNSDGRSTGEKMQLVKPPLHIVTTIPPEVEQYAPDIARFIEAMVYKLGVHSGKGKWENMPIGKALELLRGEEKELTAAVARGNMVDIMLEAADVANYALIASAIAMDKK